jgi:hypothetical protein
MIADCAVDPEVMARWEFFQMLHADFGVGQGRLLCEFPGKWRKLFLERAAEFEANKTNSPRQAAMLLDQYQHGTFRRGLVASGREYPAGTGWSEAARATLPPFDLIIHSETPSTACELRVGEILRLNPPFARPRQAEVKRKAADLVACGWPCFRRAKEIAIIDPYFRPRDGKFGRVLGHFLARLERECPPPKRLEVHTKLPEHYDPSIQRGNWNHWANEHLPSGWKLRIVHWEELETGGTLHARYVLTDYGGLDYNWGIDEDPGEHTQVSLLDDPFWERLYRRFIWTVESTPQVFRDFPNRILDITG